MKKLPLGTELVCIKESEVLFMASVAGNPKGVPCNITEGMQGIICGYWEQIGGTEWVSVSIPMYEIAVQVPASTFEFIWAQVP
jgi:hypothetical protein